MRAATYMSLGCLASESFCGAGRFECFGISRGGGGGEEQRYLSAASRKVRVQQGVRACFQSRRWLARVQRKQRMRLEDRAHHNALAAAGSQSSVDGLGGREGWGCGGGVGWVASVYDNMSGGLSATEAYHEMAVQVEGDISFTERNVDGGERRFEGQKVVQNGSQLRPGSVAALGVLQAADHSFDAL